MDAILSVVAALLDCLIRVPTDQIQNVVELGGSARGTVCM
jgi:hypothetical protein